MSSNVREYSVSELSGELKRKIEDSFSYVRVRGELGRVTRAGSGHVYLDLKDERAVLSAVIWKGNASKLKIQPEQGMEMIATGRLTTFPGQSRYQIIVDTLEPAGAGALMALFEERKKKLAAEGLFAPERKKELPYLPGVIGVVTSPSGAVIRDILHRLRDRFPSHVLVWPTLVQGEQAAAQIVRGINGFNALSPGGAVPRPDVLIVARGGGSLEDLWCFNEETVARAAAASEIPLISAVGHETDTTLIDFVSDRRAPTPTAAAEMAVPVRTELLMELDSKARRMTGAAARLTESRRTALISAVRGLGRPEAILEIPAQRLDQASTRLGHSLRVQIDRAENRLLAAAGGTRPTALRQHMARQDEALEALTRRLQSLPARLLERLEARLATPAKLLESLSYRSILSRGFALVTDKAGQVLRRSDSIASGQSATVRFQDGERQAVFDGSPGKTQKKAVAAKATASRSKSSPPKDQKTLFD